MLNSWLTVAPRYTLFPPRPDVPADLTQQKLKRRAPYKEEPGYGCHNTKDLKWKEYARGQSKKRTVGERQTTATQAGSSPEDAANHDADTGMEDAGPPEAPFPEPTQDPGADFNP